MRKGVFLSLFLAAVFVCDAAWGADVTVSFTATVSSVDDSYSGMLNGRIEVGDPITGYYTYDSLTADSNGSSEIGDYRHNSSGYGIFIDIDGATFYTNPNNVEFYIGINNKDTDYYGVTSYNNLSNLPDVTLGTMGWGIHDSTGTAVSSDALPAVPPDLADWETDFSFAINGDSCTYFGIFGEITSTGPGTPLPKVCGYRLVGDLNDDCEISLADVALLLSNWLVNCDVTPGDDSCVAKFSEP